MEFSNKQSVATILLTILNDNLAELPEITYIRLLKVTESGSSLEGKGAQLGNSKALHTDEQFEMHKQVPKI